MTERRVSPVAVNASITRWTEDHFVWLVPGQQATGLLVLLPGTNGAPVHGSAVGRIGAEQGYRVIGLMYPDDLAVVPQCVSDPAANCMELMRQEIVQGIDVSSHVVVDVPNSINGRLADLLKHLDRAYPDEEWDDFLANGAPRWEAIAVGGLSQGGGHAAYIAKVHAVPRVVMFGAPADGFSGQVAPWMQLGATRADRYFGFRHQRDPWTSITPNWLALGLDSFGPAKLMLGFSPELRRAGEGTTMKFESAMLAALILVGCFPSSDDRSPTAPTPPAETPQPPPLPPLSTSTSSVWVMVIGESGACIDGATVEIVDGQGLGQKLTQKADCDYWAYSGGVTFLGLTPRVSLTLRASAAGYVTEEKTIAPKSGNVGPVYFLPARSH